MKGIRLKIMLLTALMLTLCCGLLFYRSLYTFDGPKSVQNLEFEELRSLDLQLNANAYYLRKNINADTSDLKAQSQRIQELLTILKDMKITSPDMSEGVKTVQAYFKSKEKKIESFISAHAELRTNVNQFVSRYNELAKNKITFSLDKNDKRDFFRECLTDVYMYLSFSSKENEGRLLEDLKIMSQVINYAEAPNPLIQSYYNGIESILKSVKTTDQLIEDFHQNGINNEMNLIAKSYHEDSLNREKDNETFVKLVFAAFVFYLIAMTIIIRKN